MWYISCIFTAQNESIIFIYGIFYLIAYHRSCLIKSEGRVRTYLQLAAAVSCASRLITCKPPFYEFASMPLGRPRWKSCLHESSALTPTEGLFSHLYQNGSIPAKSISLMTHIKLIKAVQTKPLVRFHS